MVADLERYLVCAANQSAKAEKKLAGKGKGKEENLEEILAQVSDLTD